MKLGLIMLLFFLPVPFSSAPLQFPSSSRLYLQHYCVNIVCMALKNLIPTNDWNLTPNKNKISNLAYNQIYNLNK